MIFNSISKEIGNSQLRHTSYQPHDYQPSYGNHSRLSNQDYITNSRIEDSASSISHMNQKITENLDYLKYKDYSRDNQLRGSRVSNRSSHSRQSHQSNRSSH